MQDNIFTNILNNLTESELKTLARVVQERLDAVTEENKKKQTIKENYTLNNIPLSFEIDYANLGKRIKEQFDSCNSSSIDVSVYKKILDENILETPPKKEEIYNCPECGKPTLKINEFGACGYSVYKYAVACNSCDFTMERKEDSEKNAWKLFHDWLVDNGYLDKSVKFQW